MKLAMRIMRHEGWLENIDVFDENTTANMPDDPWSANCSIPKMLFFNQKKDFEKEFPMYKVLKKEKNECFMFFLSGGVIAKTFYLPVNDSGVNFISLMDKTLVKLFPYVFTAGCSIVLEKI